MNPLDSPQMTDEARAASFPLNGWDASDGQATTTAAAAYGYAASLALANALAERVGTDVLAAVWSDADSGTGAYQPPQDTRAGGGAAVGATTSEGVQGASDWRALLDLLEARSGQDLTQLWREWVVRPDEAVSLDARAAARASYGRTLALADGWHLPRAIRDALRSWQFEMAETLMADARTLLAQRKGVTAMAEREGLELPDDMRVLFESGSIADAGAEGDAERDAILAIGDALGVRSSDDDILSRIGMLGEHPESDLAEASSALAAGDLDGSVAASDRAFRAWTIAWEEGRRRALMVLAAFATVVVLGSAIVGTFRRSRRAATSPVAPGSASSGDGPAPA